MLLFSSVLASALNKLIVCSDLGDRATPTVNLLRNVRSRCSVTVINICKRHSDLSTHESAIVCACLHTV